MDVVGRIKELTKKRGWSQYRLARESELPMSTISNIFTRGTVPSIATIEILCEAFGITLSDFFAIDDDRKYLDKQQLLVLEYYSRLSKKQRSGLIEFLDTLF